MKGGFDPKRRCTFSSRELTRSGGSNADCKGSYFVNILNVILQMVTCGSVVRKSKISYAGMIIITSALIYNRL